MLLKQFKVGIFFLILILSGCNNPPDGVHVNGDKAETIQIYFGLEMQDSEEYDLKVKWLTENGFEFDSVSFFKNTEEIDSLLSDANIYTLNFHYSKKK